MSNATKGPGRYSGRKVIRKSKPAGIEQRLDARVMAFVPEIPKGGSGTTRAKKPGSRNPRKH